MNKLRVNNRCQNPICDDDVVRQCANMAGGICDYCENGEPAIPDDAIAMADDGRPVGTWRDVKHNQVFLTFNEQDVSEKQEIDSLLEGVAANPAILARQFNGAAGKAEDSAHLAQKFLTAEQSRKVALAANALRNVADELLDGFADNLADGI